MTRSAKPALPDAIHDHIAIDSPRSGGGMRHLLIICTAPQRWIVAERTGSVTVGLGGFRSIDGGFEVADGPRSGMVTADWRRAVVVLAR